MPSRAQRKLWRSLRRRKGRADTSLFLLEGPRVLSEALASDVQVEALLCSRLQEPDAERSELADRFERAGVTVEWLDRREFAEISTTVTPQGVVGVARIPSMGWESVRVPRIVLLDRIQDPGNVGTLIRTGEALGAGAVVCLPGTADPWGPKVVRAAAGSSLRLPVITARTEEVLGRLETMGAKLWVADPAGAPVSRGSGRPARLGLALGSEGHGVSDDLRNQADRVVSIDMKRPVESLNVAVAGAILMDRIFGDTPMTGTQRGEG